jgi:hypothetical protein
VHADDDCDEKLEDSLVVVKGGGKVSKNLTMVELNLKKSWSASK